MSWDQIVEEAKAEKELVFYMWWGEEYWKTAAQKFEEKYGIKANVVIGDNNVDKLLAEKDSAVGTIDAQAFGGSSVKTVIDGGLLYGPILPKIPSAANLDPKLGAYQEGVNTMGYLVPLYRNQTGFLYDPDKISNPPQTWDDLVKFVQENPKQFAFSDPNKGGTGQAMVFTAVVNLTGGLDQYAGDTELDQAKAAKWSAVWDWFNANEDN
jgi:putative spermidine/putrescine transport system substrate-binding protein